MGRPRKPSKLKALEGNRSKVAISAVKADPQGMGRPHMPPNLSALEEEMWLDTIESLPDGLLSSADDGMLEVYVAARARFREARIQIAKTGMLIRSPLGPVRNPLLVVLNAAERAMHLSGSQLGMSPVSRARLNGADTGGDDPMSWLMGGEDEMELPALPPPARRIK